MSSPPTQSTPTPSGGQGAAKQAAADLNNILKVALKAGSSDVHIKAGLPPIFRIDGSLYPYKESQRLTPDMVNRIAYGIMNKSQQDAFREEMEIDLAYGVPGLGRFRVNIFQQFPGNARRVAGNGERHRNNQGEPGEFKRVIQHVTSLLTCDFPARLGV